MTHKEAANQLRDLIQDRRSLMTDEEYSDIYKRDIEALQLGINAIEQMKNVKHGEWREFRPSRMKWIPEESDNITEEETTIEDMTEQKCSVCNRWAIKFTHHIEMSYCPNCGARMDGDVK